MKIAQVSPLFESVPPQLYGGTERIVSYITEELVQLGHEVTLFASGDSITKARLLSPCKNSLRMDASCEDQLAHHILLLELVEQEKRNFDIIHYHIDYLHFPFSRRSPVPHLTTLHGKQSIPDLAPLYKEYIDMPVISISDEQRRPLPNANWISTVYHGLPAGAYRQGRGEGGYLAFIGRISPEKRPDRAIDIAIQTGTPIKIAAKISKTETDYFQEKIKPLMDHPLVEFIGEIGEAEKSEFLGKAKALLFPIDWPEPFGLVMIEALACGTPVIAYRNGSVPEIIEHGKTGYIVSTQQEAYKAVEDIDLISRTRCRSVFEKRFSAGRMTRDYLKAYQKVIDQASKRPFMQIAV
jgi:glycosyltransferase involved in cell wall biosynthesis